MAVWIVGCLSSRMFLVKLIPRLRFSALGNPVQPGGRFLVVVVYYAAGVSFGATCMLMIIVVDVQVAGFLLTRMFLARNILRFRGLVAGC